MAFHEKKSLQKSASKNGYTKVRFIDSDEEEREQLVSSASSHHLSRERDNNNNNDNQNQDEQQLITIVTDDKSQLIVEPSVATTTTTATTTFSNHLHHHPAASENSHVLEQRPGSTQDLFSTNRLLRNTRKMAQIGADLTAGTATATQTTAPAADHSQMRISMVSVRSDDTTVTRSGNTENEPDTESTSPYCSDDEDGWEPMEKGNTKGSLNIRLGSDGDGINVNASNNKKREGSTQSAEHDASSESSQRPTKTESRQHQQQNPSSATSHKPKTTTTSEQQHNNGLYIRPLRGDRNHSVQISSIRGLGKLEKEKKRSHWITPGHRYGKRLIEKDGSSNVYLKVSVSLFFFVCSFLSPVLHAMTLIRGGYEGKGFFMMTPTNHQLSVKGNLWICLRP